MNGKHKRPTIKQVASAAGVSTQTVSRVMNDRPDVSAETRGRVLKIVEDLGYQPSALARSLIQQRTVHPGGSDRWFEIYRSFQDVKRYYKRSGRIWLFIVAQGVAEFQYE